MAVRYKRETILSWPAMKVRWDAVTKQYGRFAGKVMFPTTHDITPEVAFPCMIVLEKLLKSGNEVLIVSKPHFQVIKLICDWFDSYKNKILFRFTIGSANNDILSYWEPGAPSFEERQESLIYAACHEFQTSVSSEPLLDYIDIDKLRGKIMAYISDAWWIGKMNDIRRRVNILTFEDEKRVAEIESNQTDDKIKKLYNAYKDNPKIKWKESIKKVVGIELSTKSGEDK